MSTPPPVAAEPTAEAAESRTGRKLEVWSAILLGVAAIVTAWAAYRSAILDGNALQGYSDSTALTSQVSEAYGEGDTQKAFDQSVYVAYAQEQFRGDPDGVARYIRENVASEQLQQALDWYDTTGDEVTTPFDTDAGSPYYLPGYERGNEYAGEAAHKYEEAVQADNTGDSFELASVLLAISLFFGGIANIFKNTAPQVAVLGIGSVTLVGGVVQMLAAGLF